MIHQSVILTNPPIFLYHYVDQ